MTIRMFIGTSSNGEDAEAEMVYEYSIRKNTSEDVNITWMRQTHDVESVWGGWNTHRWSTPFSGYRWGIPAACNFEGRAIYTDLDMINFRDIADLWNTDLKNKPIAARRGKRFDGHEFCVMVIDCAMIASHLIPLSRMKSIEEHHHRMIHKFSGNDDLVCDLDPRWNCLDGEDRAVNDMWILHYTNMATQPWRPAWYTGKHETHPRQDMIDLWYSMKSEALNSNYVTNIPNVAFGPYDIIGR